MIQSHQKGRAIFGVIAVIAVIALLCSLIVYICRVSYATTKAKEIAEAVAIRSQLYCPDVPVNHSKMKSSKYLKNGPYGATIILDDEEETPQPEKDKLYFSVVVEIPSKSVCTQLIKTDVFNPDLVTINEDPKGQCPGRIRFYFTCSDKLQPEEMMDALPPSYDEPAVLPHFTFANHTSDKNTHNELKCKEPLPYEDKNGNCVECITASQCHESQDCVENMCEDCPQFSSRTVRIGQRIGTRNCYCQEGYQLNTDQNGCIRENSDWDINQNCVGNHCSVCPKNARHDKGQRIGTTDCYCEDGYLPRQTGTTQWQCAKVAILYPEPDNQIIIHDEKYAEPAPQKIEKEQLTAEPSIPLPTVKPQQIRPVIVPQKPMVVKTHEPVYIPVFEEFEDIFTPGLMPQDSWLPFPTDGNWDIQAWESLEITIQ